MRLARGYRLARLMAIRTQEPAAAPIIARTPIEAYLGRLHARYSGLRDGVVADYIPELANADPDAFGIAIATTEGAIYEVGDTRRPFTIQSISKPLTYALVLDVLGERDIPVLGDVDVGHNGPNVPMPLGIRAEMDADAVTLSLVEPVVTASRR